MLIIHCIVTYSSTSNSDNDWDDLLKNSSINLKKPRSCWTHEPLQDYKDGDYFKTYPEKFKEYFRTSIEMYDYIYILISVSVFNLEKNMEKQ